jgi:N-acetylglutamate synthase/N-acetylornithine aminotransferase
MENTTLLRSISFAAVLVWPLVAIAQPVSPTVDDLQQSYQAIVSNFAKANAMLSAQVAADQREIEKLKADKAKPEEPKTHGP